MDYYHKDPVIRLRDFTAWAVSNSWSLPVELAQLATPIVEAELPKRYVPDKKRVRGRPTNFSIGSSVPITAAARGPGGRKKGSGSIEDGQSLCEMLRLLAAGKARSVHDAASKVTASKPGPNQSRVAEIARLRKKFAKQHGTEPPAGKTWIDVEVELKGN
jgi:hypothetical protein